MRVVLQRVSHADVVIEGQVNGAIEHGYMILVGFKDSDTQAIINRMVEKIVNLRVFEDDHGKLNRSLLDVGGSVLSISQFTLYANAKKGRRPSFVEAAKPDLSSPLYDAFNKTLEQYNVKVERGIFGADMKVTLTNDGPVTIVLDSDQMFPGLL
ncbi:MAG: D-tyrosyl-tRNA(Tyr) deacylase [Erysipelotrichaceae bacterium]|nr:D-tyrosyl-tRNA(Tyr) deacylase [Erysipelotrichaceae bacterium]